MVFPTVYEMTTSIDTIKKQHFWEYFSGSKLQIGADESGFTGTWDKSPSDSQFEVSGGKLNFLENANAGGDRTWYDLGTNVSETKWVLRVRLRFTTIANQSDYPEIDFGISNNHANSDTNQDFIGCRILPMAFNNLFRPRKCIAEKPRRGSSANHNPSPAFTTGKDYYFEFKRTSATNWSASMSNTNAYDGDIYSGSFTNASTSLNGLRYFTVMDSTTATSGNMEGYIDVFEFYNGVTDVNDNTIRWNKSNSNAGYTIAMDDTDNGLKMINNASHTHSAVLDFNNIHQYNATASEFIYVGKTATSSGGSVVGLAKDYRQDNAYDSAMVQWDAGNSGGTVYTLSSDGTTQTAISTGITRDANYHVYKLGLTPTAITCKVDGVTGTSKTSNRPADPLMPVVKSYSYSGNTTQLNIRYFEAYNT